MAKYLINNSKKLILINLKPGFKQLLRFVIISPSLLVKYLDVTDVAVVANFILENLFLLSKVNSFLGIDMKVKYKILMSLNCFRFSFLLKSTLSTLKRKNSNFYFFPRF